MWDHVEKLHDLEPAAFETGRELCPICKTRVLIFTPSGIRHFKSHTQKVYKIKLRP
jgi:hypothetical protein